MHDTRWKEVFLYVETLYEIKRYEIQRYEI